MHYSALVKFEPIESVIQLEQAESPAAVQHLVQTFVISQRMAEQLCDLVIPFGQNIRTCFPTGSYASTIAHASACLPLHSYPYSAFLWTAQAEGGANGLATLAGVYHGDRRSGTAATQRVLRRFLKKNILHHGVETGWIRISHWGNSGWRSRRSSTTRIARLLSATPFWYTFRLSSTIG
jgi:Family of unknown function (DUF6079)